MKKSYFNMFLVIITITGMLVISGCGSIIYISQAQTTPSVPTQIDQNLIEKDIQETHNYNFNTSNSDFSEGSNGTTNITVEGIEQDKTNPYIFKSDGNDIDFSTGHMGITFYEGLLSGKQNNFEVVSPINLGNFKTINEALSLNSRTGLIEDEKYNNLLLTLHSGYTLPDRPLEGEFLRYSMEKLGEEEEEYVEKRLLEVIGSKGTMSLDGAKFQIEVIGAIRLRREESLEINSFPSTVLDIATKKDEKGQYVALGNAEPFEDAKLSHELIINFCGWGPNKQYTYYRYLFLIDIKEN